MRSYQCHACDFKIIESDKNWDVAIQSGNCPSCNQHLNNIPSSTHQTFGLVHIKAPSFKTLLLFALGGPVLGVLPLLLFMLSVPLIFVLAIAYSVLIGFIPGVIAGLLFNFFLHSYNISQPKQEVIAGFVSGLLSMVLLCVFIALTKRFEDVMYFFVIIGAFSGACCGYLNRYIKANVK